MEHAYVAGNQPVMVRLQFDPSVAGKVITVTASAGIIFDPPEAALVVRPTGESVATVRLADEFAHGHVDFSCDGIRTTVPFERSSPAVVASHESAEAR